MENTIEGYSPELLAACKEFVEYVARWKTSKESNFKTAEYITPSERLRKKADKIERRDELILIARDLLPKIESVCKSARDTSPRKSQYRIRYYYLATGMEGKADERDYGIVEANSPNEAINIVLDREYPHTKHQTRDWLRDCLLVSKVD